MRLRVIGWLVLVGATLIGCSATFTGQNSRGLESPSDEETIEPVELPDLGKAPEIANEIWLNTPEPLRLADLRGKVVLVEFWTFG